MNFYSKLKFYFNMIIVKKLVCLVSFLSVVGLDRIKLTNSIFI